MTFWEIESLIAEHGHLKAVALANKETKAKKVIEVDALLVQFGFLSSLGAIKDWPIHIEKSSIRVNAFMETHQPGIFAVGDVATFDGKLKLIATGFGEAAIAVCTAKTRIDPHAKMFPGHSSEMTSQAESIVTV
jgi:ferredoxin/flavodoxin---NADP+ reductase